MAPEPARTHRSHSLNPPRPTSNAASWSVDVFLRQEKLTGFSVPRPCVLGEKAEEDARKKDVQIVRTALQVRVLLDDLVVQYGHFLRRFDDVHSRQKKLVFPR